MTPTLAAGRIGLVLRALVALAAGLLLVRAACAEPPMPVASGGVLDLRGVDLAREVVELRGEWRFTPGRFLDPAAPVPQGAAALAVPGPWNAANGGGLGHGTYSLEIQCTSAKGLALLLPVQRTAVRYFVNGREVASQGQPGADLASAISSKASRLAMVGDTACPMQLTAHVSNFNHRLGGLIRPVELGPEARVRSRYESTFALSIALVSGVLVLALLPLLFFITRPKEKPPLWFGLFCLSLALYMALFREGVLRLVVSEPGWEPYLKVEYLAWYSSSLFFLLFMRSMYPDFVRAGPVRVFVGLAGAVAAFVLLAPGRVYTHALPAFQLFALLSGGYCAYAIASAARAGRDGTRILLVAIAIIVVALGLDMVRAAEPLRATILPFASLLFALAPAAVLIRRYGRALTREELRLSEERQRTGLLVRATKAGFMEWDARAGTTVYSERFKEMLGYPPQADTGAWGDHFSLVHPEDRERLRELFMGQLRDRSAPSAQRFMAPSDYRMLRADGSPIWVRAEAILVTGPDGRVLRHVCSFIDISASKQHEAELATEQRRLDLVVRASQSGIVDWDGKTHATWYSPRFRQIRGYPPDTDTSDWPDYFKVMIHPDDRERVTARFRAYIMGKGPEGPLEFYDREEYRLSRADGSYVWVQIMGVCTRDENGFATRFIAAVTDITERRAQEEAARASRDQIAAQAAQLEFETDRLALLVRATRAGFMDWNSVTGEMAYSERFKEMLGYPRDADTTAWPTLFDMMHPDDREEQRRLFREMLRRASATGEREHGPLEYRIRKADGSYLWVRGEGISRHDADGRTVRFLTSYIDITQMRKINEALQESVRLREEVERIARHDLKTPLNSIVAAARLLREERTPTEGEAELLDVVERAGYRVLSMVNLSFDIFRMERGDYRFQPQAVDLTRLVERIATDLRIHAVSKGVGLRIRSGGRAVYAWADELLCYSILANLMKNAIEASPDSAAVTVDLEEAAPNVRLLIHNPGEVPERVRAHFFEKYTTSGKSGGLGLGTYSARLLARVQQGDIVMRTSAEAGTTLEITLLALPAGVQAPAPPGERGESRAAPAANLPPLKVLVVDDDEYNLLVMRRSLPSPPLTVRTEANGRAALDALEAFEADAVFMDIEMPVMDGHEAVRRIRERERATGAKPVPIVAFSSHDDEESRRKSLANGCNVYLRKPAAREAVHRVLLELTGHASLARPGSGPAQEPESALPAGPADAVVVDADMRDTIPQFLRSRREAIAQMGDALREGDATRVRKLAHKLSGSFALYGFAWASAQSRAIETCAAGEAGWLQQLAELSHHVDHVKIRYSDEAPVDGRPDSGG